MQELLKKLNNLSITVDLLDEQLNIKAPKGVMSREILQEIKENKESLIDFIAKYKVKSSLELEPIPEVDAQDGYRLSSQQYRLWLLDQMEEGNTAYNMPNIYEISGTINEKAFESALEKLIERHEILRTNFRVKEDGEVYQFVKPVQESTFKLSYKDVSGEVNKEAIAATIIKQELAISFDLSKDILLRATLLKTSENKYVFSFILHHIVTDGWSSNIIARDLFTFYDSISKGKDSSIAPLTVQYNDYSVWQQSLLKSTEMAAHKAYWLDKFKGEIPVLDLPGYQARPTEKTYKGNTVVKNFSKKLTEDLTVFCRSQGATLYTALLTAVKVLVYRCTNQKDIVIGIPVSGREHPDLQQQVGFYVNTLPLRSTIVPEESFKTLFTKVKGVILEAQTHQQYPFDELIKSLNLRFDRSRNPLFDLIVTFEEKDMSLKELNASESITVQPYPVVDNTSKFDLEFVFKEREEGIDLLLTYNTDIYDQVFVQQLTNNLEHLLEAVLKDTQAPIHAADFLSPDERNKIIYEFNNTKIDYPTDKTFVGLFREQVKMNPERLGIVDKDQTFSYKDLDDRSDKLASYLRTQFNIEKGKFVGVKLQRGEPLITTFLAIMKIGGVYIPIDIEYPDERIKFIENDSACNVIIDDIFLETFQNHNQVPVDLLDVSIAPNDLAYIIYTSGSTGKPKGVMVEHRNLLNLCFWHGDYYHVTHESRATLFAGIAFDASIWEFAPYLINGASLHPIDDDEIRLDLNKLYEFFINREITHCYLPTQVCQEFIDQNRDLKNLTVLTGGDVFKLKKFSKFKIYNNYGPTENTIVTTSFDAQNVVRRAIPIGRPIANTQVYILDDHMQIQPIGISGKLYVSGAGVSRGYLNLDELTNTKFIKNPFSPDQRMYDTGDMAKWLPDGNLEFLGRQDHQVKIRGHRIELEEIENVMLRYSDRIKQVIVSVKAKENEKFLVGYFVAESIIDKALLREFLQKKLPPYMLPSFFVALDEVPLTPNGKIDRNALPDVVAEDIMIKEYVGPRNNTEQQLAKIWQEVLLQERIDVTLNFFDLGGHSLHLAQVINKISIDFGYTFSFKDFLKTPSVEEIALKIDNSKVQKAKDYRIRRANLEGKYAPLSPSQYRLWITAQLGGSKAYNIPLVFDVIGSFDPAHYKMALDALIERHSSLRTTFKQDSEKNIKQYVHESKDFVFEFKVHPGITTQEGIREEVRDKIQGEFELEGPLLKAGTFRVEEGRHVAYLVVHHLITDGWSMEIVFKEIVGNFNAIVKNGKPLQLEPLDIQYVDYVIWLNDNIKMLMEKERPFWHSVFKDDVPLVKLPFERINRPLKKTYAGFYYDYILPAGVTQKLKRFSNDLNVTAFASLVAIFKILLHKYTGDTDFTIGLPISGRFSKQLEPHVGFYLNTLAVRSKFSADATFQDVIRDENEVLVNYYDNPLYQMDELIKELNLKTFNGRNPLFDIMLVFQNQTTLNLFNEEEIPKDIMIKAWDQVDINQAQFDITIAFFEVGQEFIFQVSYNEDVFEHHHVVELLGDYRFLIDQVLKDKSVPLNVFFESNGYKFITDKEIVFQKAGHLSRTASTEDSNGVAVDEEIKRSLKEIFEASIQKEITYNDDYFEVGGNSLSTLQIVEEINTKFNADYTIMDFYDNASVNLFHNLIQQGKGVVDEEATASEKDNVLINFGTASEELSNMIFFPPILGEGLIFRMLAKTLENEYNTYAVNIPVIEAINNNDMGLNNLLDLFYKRLETLFTPDKRTYVVGYSIGVNYAFEVTKYFEEKGFDVTLVMIDRGTDNSGYKVNKEMIDEVIKYHQPLIDNAKILGIDEEVLNQRIAQSMKIFSTYKLEGKVMAPIYTLEATQGKNSGYMKKWKKYTSNFEGVEYLEGNHLEALYNNNVSKISNLLKEINTTKKILVNE